jgi:acyl-CoA thioesterase-2
MTAVGHGAEPRARSTFADLLQVEELDRDLFRSVAFAGDPSWLYGGQVAAQALMAAAGTVATDRVPHSLHGYFLRGGDSTRPIVYRVSRDRDGRSYSARRVEAIQAGEVIFDLAMSFHVPETSIDHQVARMPVTAPPRDLPTLPMGEGIVGIEFRPADPEHPAKPTRAWAGTTEPLPHDPYVNAALITYVSDMFTGLYAIVDGPPHAYRWTSLDHAMWFYRPMPPGQWLLMDLEPESIAYGRGMYRGRIFAEDGTLVAGLSQESVFRKIRSPRPV